MSLVVVAVIIGVAIIWKVTADGTDAGVLGPLYTDKADPATTNFVPRPDWFFYFLFYLLRIFKWPETVVLGTVGAGEQLLGDFGVTPASMSFSVSSLSVNSRSTSYSMCLVM